MQVRRTGAKKGQSPIWYVQASTEAEKEAMKAGLLEDRSPDWRYPYTLIWGCKTKSYAVKIMERIEPVVDEAVATVLGKE